MNTNYTQGQRGGIAKALLILVALIILAIVVLTFLMPRSESALGTQSIFESFKQRLSKGVVPESKHVKADSELIREAITNNRGFIVKIYNNKNTMIARGIIIGNGGIIATDAFVVRDGEEYTVRIPGQRESIKAVHLGGNTDVAIIQVNAAVTANLVAQVDDKVHNGDVVAAIAGGEKESVAVGVVTREFVENGTIATNLIGQIVPGTPLINKHGKLIGISSSMAGQGNKEVFASTLTMLGALEVVSRASAKSVKEMKDDQDMSRAQQ